MNKINKLIILIFFNFSIINGLDLLYTKPIKPFTIMLNPAGDAKDAGRVLNDSFERGVTLQFCQELKKEIEANFNNTRVVLTRIPGETLEHLQNANYANRLDVDFYLSIHFYKETETLPQVFMYHYIIDPFYSQSSLQLHFYTYDNAFLINIIKTLKFGNIIKTEFENNLYKNQFNFKGFFGVPFKPLIGIKSPSLALEIGLKSPNDWQDYIRPVIESIRLII